MWANNAICDHLFESESQFRGPRKHSKCFDIDGFVVKVCWYMRGYHSIDMLENTYKTDE